MNKIIDFLANQYSSTKAIEKRIKFCEERSNKMHTVCSVHMSFGEEIPFLYAAKEYLVIKNQQYRNNLYKTSITNLMDEQKDECYLERDGDEYKYSCRRYFEFFFPIELMSKTGILYPIMGFKIKSACAFINYFIIAEKNYPDIDIYDIMCCHRITGNDFVTSNIRRYADLFPGIPARMLYTLYTYQQPGSKAIGAGEYLICLKIKNVTKSTGPDVCCTDGTKIEMKGHSGRVDCQKKPKFEKIDEYLVKMCGMEFKKDTLLEDGMIKVYNKLKDMGYDNKYIIYIFASCMIRAYEDHLTKEQIDLFVKNMVENTGGFLFDGEFNINSIYRINLCTMLYAYPLLEDFTHLMVDSKLPDIKHKSDFDVQFRIFSRDDFATPGLILNLIEKGLIYTDGLLKKNSSRDTAPHIYIHK